MNLCLVYGKILKYHKWRIVLYSLFIMGVTIFIVLQLQQRQYRLSGQLAEQYHEGVRVRLYQELQDEDYYGEMTSYFNSISFSVLSMTAMGTILLLSVMENEKIKKRSMYAPVHAGMWRLQEIGISLLPAPVIWMLHATAAVALFGNSVLSIKAIMMCGNAFILSISGIGLAFLLVSLTRDCKTSAFLLHTTALIVCLISGAFLPAYYLGNTAKEVAAFTPVYWYVHANSLIRGLQFSDPVMLLDLFKCFGMQLVFGVAFYVLAVALQRQREEQS